MKLAVVATQNDYSQHMDRLPELAKYLLGVDGTSEVDLELVNVVCAEALEAEPDRNAVALRSCLRMISVISAFKSFTNSIVEACDADTLRVLCAVEAGRFSRRGDDVRAVVITGDEAMRKMLSAHAESYGLHVLAPADLAA